MVILVFTIVYDYFMVLSLVNVIRSLHRVRCLVCLFCRCGGFSRSGRQPSTAWNWCRSKAWLSSFAQPSQASPCFWFAACILRQSELEISVPIIHCNPQRAHHIRSCVSYLSGDDEFSRGAALSTSPTAYAAAPVATTFPADTRLAFVFRHAIISK